MSGNVSCYQEPCTIYQDSEEEEFEWNWKDGSQINRGEKVAGVKVRGQLILDVFL